ncbi:MAG: hypothetical protein O7E52_05655 [Candidatus Poribacteria bacterium]|nr:hypothetical protein [Candidatus Poribacteria bacterium]
MLSVQHSRSAIEARLGQKSVNEERDAMGQITHCVSLFMFHFLRSLHTSRGWIWFSLSAFLACGPPTLVVPEPGTMAVDFTLKDQYDTEFRLHQFRGENVLLVGFDKDSVDQGGNWFQIFLDRYANDLRVLPIANGSGVPFFAKLFLKGKIKAELRGDEAEPPPPSILLDWTGKVSRQYGMRFKMSTVVLIHQSGRIQLVQPLGRMTQEEMQRIFDLIDPRIFH